MKKITTLVLALVLAVGFLGISSTVEAATRVKGYYKPSTGKYIAPHYRSSPNKYKIDNYSTKGNYNPYTGKKGTKKLYSW
jgi:hypothetical protein